MSNRWAPSGHRPLVLWTGLSLASLTPIAAPCAPRPQEPLAKVGTAAKECFSTSLPRPGSLLVHSDGHLMLLRKWEVVRSYDGGRSWSEPMPFAPPYHDGEMGLDAVLRLQDGKFGFVRDREIDPDAAQFVIHELYWWTTDEDGKEWSQPIRMNPSGQLGLPYLQPQVDLSETAQGTPADHRSHRVVLPLILRARCQAASGTTKTAPLQVEP